MLKKTFFYQFSHEQGNKDTNTAEEVTKCERMPEKILLGKKAIAV